MGSQLVDLVIAEVRRDNHEVIGALRRLSALGSDLLAELSGPLADSARIESLILSVVSQQRRLHSQIDEAITQSPLWPFMLSRKCLAKPLGGAGFGAAWTVFPPVSDDVMAALAAAGWTAQSVEVVPYGVRSWKDA
jgi:hypothetical protein